MNTGELGAYGYPSGLAVTPDGNSVYVADGSVVLVISTATNTITNTIPVVTSNENGYVNMLAITPNGEYVYLACDITGASCVMVINTAEGQVTATLTLGSNPWAVAITPNGAYAYVGKYDGSVAVIKTSDNSVTNIPETVTGMNDPTGVAVTPDGAYVYFTTNGPVTVMSTASNTVVTKVDIAIKTAPSDIAITPNGAYAYITDGNAGGVHVIPTFVPPGFPLPETPFGPVGSIVAMMVPVVLLIYYLKGKNRTT